ncbi:hypothetical protein [Nocardia sp. R7R-8]|uniref:hypothetical protein n=1 Tax=Nocardia sp. R7R-8 TaxID=3459304 RepID=UPI00403DC205
MRVILGLDNPPAGSNPPNGDKQLVETLLLPSDATVTHSDDGTTTVGIPNPATGGISTTVTNAHGAVVATAESEIVPGTGGLSRDTTITDAAGHTTYARSVDDGYGNITTWTANPDGSHSVRYPDGLIVKEPAPGSSTPAEVVQLSRDGRSGHVIEYNLDNTITEASFRPGVLGTPVTDITNPDNTHIQVVTVPGNANGAPFSILTQSDGSRSVLQPDGTSVPIDRYNNAIAGPGYGNQFDPFTGTWRTDLVTRRGPLTTAPDGTSTQEWFYHPRGGEEYSVTVHFDTNRNVARLENADYTGITITEYRTVDGITLPTTQHRLDAGRVTDDAALVFDTAFLVTGVGDAWTIGRWIGTRLIACQLTARAATPTQIDLITSQLTARAATTFTPTIPRQFGHTPDKAGGAGNRSGGRAGNTAAPTQAADAAKPSSYSDGTAYADAAVQVESGSTISTDSAPLERSGAPGARQIPLAPKLSDVSTTGGHLFGGLLSAPRRAYELPSDVFQVPRWLRSKHSDLDPAVRPPRDTHFLDPDADPLRRHGPAAETHPEQVQELKLEAKRLEVEINYGNGMAYGPAGTPGNPGTITMDPDASFGAWLHEFKHMRDDAAAGWPAMGRSLELDYRARMESRAYREEIKYAQSIDDKHSMVLLYLNLKEELKKIYMGDMKKVRRALKGFRDE